MRLLKFDALLAIDAHDMLLSGDDSRLHNRLITRLRLQSFDVDSVLREQLFETVRVHVLAGHTQDADIPGELA